MFFRVELYVFRRENIRLCCKKRKRFFVVKKIFQKYVKNRMLF
ncbi:hypothetical protein BACPLE_02051 [Phocaeicola plebeius DSM 17135]|uniref:Uncharacterized protein n=1 Tax=Phocaeicola plebeius (strain DSM 17135 / JCM 12973 / CCUG 54634 / M2) TaxID=484018 RepID=B5CZ94_PHOPM|nr:hypothetical protein BACPLE_02051 [Phocaeicola plebeius DSM 17135]